MARHKLPKPRSWEDFEDIVCDLMSHWLNCRNMQRYGRQGQKQKGVDIAGVTTRGTIGIQCKHHPNAKIPKSEIDDEVNKAQNFQPVLAEYYVVTSADRDVDAHSHILALRESRLTRGLFPIDILFWEDVVDLLWEFPDLIHRHFRDFPIEQSRNYSYPLDVDDRKATVTWSVSSAELRHAINQTQMGMNLVTNYTATVGLTSFPDVRFDGHADVQLLLANLFENEQHAPENFDLAAAELQKLRVILLDHDFYSPEIWVDLNARLPLAFLFGYVFRKVSRFKLRLIANDLVWGTENLPQVPTKLEDKLPQMFDANSEDLAVCLNISRDIDSTVVDFVQTWEFQPRMVVVINLPNRQIETAAHALSVAIEISHKIKSYIDNGNIHHIHLFAALPTALATLISYHLNAICPISIYFRDSSRRTYLLGGTLTNDM